MLSLELRDLVDQSQANVSKKDTVEATRQLMEHISLYPPMEKEVFRVTQLLLAEGVPERAALLMAVTCVYTGGSA